jgi:hypothetical protein
MGKKKSRSEFRYQTIKIRSILILFTNASLSAIVLALPLVTHGLRKFSHTFQGLVCSEA